MMRCCFRTIYTLLLACLLQGCAVDPPPPRRPPNVPADAVRLPGAKNGGEWVRCSLKAGQNVCTVFNAGGVLLKEDDVYRPYDQGPTVAAQDLQIDAERSSYGMLHLRNGRILILASGFSFYKEVIDAERGLHR
jgi:hypothetical protein